MPLVSHLRGDLVLAGELGQHARLVDGVGQRFLAVNMFAQADGHRSGRGVGMIGSGDRHRVDIFIFCLQHIAEVGILGGRRVPVEHVRRLAGIHVTKRHDVLAFAAVDVDLPFAAGTDRCDIEAFVRAEHTAWYNHREGNRAGRHSCGSQEFSTTNGRNLWSCHKLKG